MSGLELDVIAPVLITAGIGFLLGLGWSGLLDLIHDWRDDSARRF
jgi:hypothetical protein